MRAGAEAANLGPHVLLASSAYGNVRQRPEDFINLRVEPRQIVLDRVPDNFQVHLKIAVCDGVTHLVGKGERQFRMYHRVYHREIRKLLLDSVARLAYD